MSHRSTQFNTDWEMKKVFFSGVLRVHCGTSDVKRCIEVLFLLPSPAWELLEIPRPG